MPEHRPEAIDAMQALFDLAEAIDKGVTIGDLTEVMLDAIGSGHDSMAIALSMSIMALGRATPR